jgi:hypothetical protein
MRTPIVEKLSIKAKKTAATTASGISVLISKASVILAEAINKLRSTASARSATRVPTQPRKPEDGAGSTSPDSSTTLFPCPFRHNQYSMALPSPKRYGKRYELESAWTCEFREKTKVMHPRERY